jgi:hypothetical protein
MAHDLLCTESLIENNNIKGLARGLEAGSIGEHNLGQ